MMTCRLLCALLVLALCCCPSACVMASESKPHQDADLSDIRPQFQAIADNGEGSGAGAGALQTENALSCAEQDSKEKPCQLNGLSNTANAGQDGNKVVTEIKPNTTNTSTTMAIPPQPTLPQAVAAAPAASEERSLALQELPGVLPLPPTSTIPSPEPSPAVTVSAKETIPTALTGSQNTTETTSTTPSSLAKTAPEASEKTSGDGAPNQQREETDQPDSMNNANTGSSAETTATSSTSTNGSTNVKKKEGEDENDAQRPHRKAPQENPEDSNTHDAPKANETAAQKPQTDTVAQTNTTSNSVDSDGSTAVSHTTSPLLLLLVVACAAAAAVVAA
ncbi:mucin-associated surface protein (MASP) [Trypanosoma cruzi Dm28c]|uniref:Mucin-associated surface protein (MASP) n=2 Tax=Trypanosoma cruzi TaxID=5693 RepID=V5D281_TRYCR|nr:mucin-associated surface protein (MASP) [Trypanosoma cruzi Dm28c]PBJ70971.1 mucin-associated surface protein [Trypanosoma cruzi cruzi]PWV01997.1 putative mucin-associated surface protein (MASP) [Trypanosoma cruzi]